MSERAEVRGVLRRIIWQRDERIIGEVQTGDRRLTVLGALPGARVGQEYDFIGTMAWSDRYNRNELRFVAYRTILPTNVTGIWQYLVEHVPHIGPVAATQLCETYGDQTLKELRARPHEVLAGVRGMTPERIDEIADALFTVNNLEEARLELYSVVGSVLGPATIDKAIERWGHTAGARIRENPYILMRLPRVGWALADMAALRLGMAPDDPRRHTEALKAAAHQMVSTEGHTRLRGDVLMQAANRLVGQFQQSAAVAECIERGDLMEDEGDYLPAHVAVAELDICRDLVALHHGFCRTMPPVDEDGLGEDQRHIARLMNYSPVCILTGAPGTGKTYTVARIVRALLGDKYKLRLMAPTGKAARQMARALGATEDEVQPSTIHSALGAHIEDESWEFTFSRHNPLEADAVIVDETSMVDVPLMRSLLAALRRGTRLLLVGDHYQLPSVGPGAVLRDLLAGGVPAVELTQVRRNAGQIAHACHQIKDGQMPAPSSRFDLPNGDNWVHQPARTPDEIMAAIRGWVLRLSEEFDPHTQIQVLGLVNTHGNVSIAKLNMMLREIMLPGVPTFERLPFGVGDRVVSLRNRELPLDDGSGDQKVLVANGDIGTVVDLDGNKLLVRFRDPDRLVQVPRDEHELRLAYALTTHKFQGSESPVVILPLAREWVPIPLWNREWIYTAMSRAKVKLVTIGDLWTLETGIRRIGNTYRRTSLSRLLEESWNAPGVLHA